MTTLAGFLSLHESSKQFRIAGKNMRGLSSEAVLALLRSALLFRDFASGRLGLDMVEEFIDKLSAFSSLQVPDFAQSFFQLALEQIGETWRRFFHELQRYPYKLFDLLDLQPQDFLQEFQRLRTREASCPQCLDVEFTAILVRYISEEDEKDPEVLKVKIQNITNFLRDLTVWSPISADLVECLHGTSQSRVHRFRGARPTDSTAQEVIVLDKITSAFGKFQSWMWSEYGDKSALRRLHAYNQKKGNQYSTPGTLKLTKALTFEDLNKMLIRGNVPSLPRRLSGHLPSVSSHFHFHVSGYSAGINPALQVAMRNTIRIRSKPTN